MVCVGVVDCDHGCCGMWCSRAGSLAVEMCVLCDVVFVLFVCTVCLCWCVGVVVCGCHVCVGVSSCGVYVIYCMVIVC